MIVLSVATLHAQHDHPVPAAPDQTHLHTDPAASSMSPRDASGTAWLPDDTPVYGIHRAWGQWEAMFHGAAFGQFLYEPGDIHRTGGFSQRQMSSANWVMLMARRPAAGGRFGLRTMLTLEPWTVGDCGFINLLATGEMCDGDTIHDRQHPHDVFMELAADYDRPLRGTVRWQIYAGLSGEPALGPAGFPHRVSAMVNPAAPISHHWLDSTHIAFGVVTVGAYDRRWKVEASSFNGREPDEHRADLDLAPLDSISGRVTFLPAPRMAIQVSAGHLPGAEAGFPPLGRSDINKVTASATYHRTTSERVWATTVAYGLNAGEENVAGIGTFDAVTNALLVESSLTLQERHAWFGRAELVEKPAHDLHAHEWLDRIFTVGKLQAGYVRYTAPRSGIAVGLGGFVSASLVPREIAARYYGRIAPGLGVFVIARPGRQF